MVRRATRTTQAHFVTLAVLATLLASTSAPLPAQYLWQQLEHGMSPGRVLERFPDARRPARLDPLADGSEDLLRLEPVNLLGREFVARFYFRAQRLHQITLAMNGAFPFAEAERMARAVAPELDKLYGPPIKSLTVERRSTGQTAEGIWRNGDTEIHLTGHNLLEDNNDSRFTVIYKVPVDRLAIERAARDLFRSMRSDTTPDGKPKSDELLRRHKLGRNLLHAMFDGGVMSGGELTTERLGDSRAFYAVLRNVNAAHRAGQTPNMSRLILAHMDSVFRKLAIRGLDPGAPDAQQVEFFRRAIATREDAERRWARHRELAIYLRDGRLVVFDSRDDEYYVLGMEPGEYSGPITGAAKAEAQRIDACMDRRRSRDACMPGWRDADTRRPRTP